MFFHSLRSLKIYKEGGFKLNSPFDGLSRTERIEEFCRLIQFPEVQEALENIIVSSLHNCNIFNRLNLIEEHLGVDEKHCLGRDLNFELGISEYEEERTPLPNLQEQLKILFKTAPIEDDINVTNVRARRLVEKLRETKPILGVVYLDSKTIKRFLQEEIDDKYKIGKNGNPRQTVSRVIDRAIILYPTEVKRGKSKNGNKTLRIELIKIEN